MMTLKNSMNKADRCDKGMLANGSVAFSISKAYFSFVKNKD
jgi:hypothetical protein